MIRRHFRAATALTLLSALTSLPACAQSLSQRIARAPDGRVQFSFATREGVCGDGRSYVHMVSGTNTEFYGSFNDLSSEPCVHGPARVVLDRASGEVVGVRVFVGPPGNDGAADLGVVSTHDAAAYLLDLAAKGEGAVARDAIMPAMLADSVDNETALVALARDQTRSRETRRGAISWLGRGPTAGGSLSSTLVSIATDETDNQSVRQQALSTLARLPGGAGMPSITQLAGDPQGGWVARTALSVISQSGDPRARDYLRAVVRKADLPDEALSVAIRSLGQQYATASDIAIIRDAWPKLTGNRSQSAAISAAAEFGGSVNAQWLLSLARDMGATSNTRRLALESAVRAGAATSELVTLYDRTTDPEMKDELISALSQAADRTSTDKLLAIAKSDESVTARRRAISALGRSSDPRVKVALEALVDRN
ncbi:MAG TPA: HEAT repeat domain-containing protein [Gemmatimonadaceae bacterium]